MVWRTPPSLNWLIKRHAALQGTLLRKERVVGEIQKELDARIAAIAETKADLQAIERALGMHEVRVDVGDIAAVTPHMNRRICPHGDVTRRIYSTLRDGGGWLRTAEIIERVTGLTRDRTDGEYYEYLRLVFRRRLQGMYRAGKIERQRCKVWSGTDQLSNQSSWRLPRLPI